MKRFLRVLLQIFYNLLTINWFTFLRYYSKDSKNVLILSEFINWKFSIEVFSWQIGTIKWFISSKVPFRLALSVKGLKPGNNVIWSPSEYYGEGIDYSVKVIEFARSLEDIGCCLFPSLEEVKWLENKNFMYEVMKDSGIPMPRTDIVNENDISMHSFTFPFILKAQYSSGSRHVNKVGSYEELQSLLMSDKYKGFSSYIFQEFLDIKKDLRVIYIDGEICSFYWRENLSEDWRPTATSKGNAVSFKNFPTDHRESIIDGFRKTGLTMAAADIAWRNDDMNTTPVFLEISSRYSPNPTLEGDRILNYGSYKKRLIGTKPFWREQVNLIHKLNFKFLTVFSDEFRTI